MPTYDYKCKECGEVFEVFRHFSELDGEVKCPNCGSGETERVFTIPHIQGETVAGSSFGSKTSEAVPATGIGGGLGRGLGRGRGPGRGRGLGRSGRSMGRVR